MWITKADLKERLQDYRDELADLKTQCNALRAKHNNLLTQLKATSFNNAIAVTLDHLKPGAYFMFLNKGDLYFRTIVEHEAY